MFIDVDWGILISAGISLSAASLSYRALRISQRQLKYSARQEDLSNVTQQVDLLESAHAAQMALVKEQHAECVRECARLSERLSIQRHDLATLQQTNIALLVQLERIRQGNDAPPSVS